MATPPILPAQTPDATGQQPDLLAAQQAANAQGPPQSSAPPTPPKVSDYRTPIGLELLRQMISPTQQGPTAQNPMSGAMPPRPPSRLDAFEHFLGNFLQSFSAGMAASGTGPGANIRGAGAAMQAPYQQDVRQFGLEQQARQQNQQLQAQQAETAARQQQTSQSAQLFPGQLQSQQGQLEAQRISNLTAGLNAQLLQRRLNFMDPEQLNTFIQTTAPPSMNPNELSVWNAGVQQAMMSGKLDSITKAADSIMKQRGTQTRSDKNLATRVAEFQQTDEYRRFALKYNGDLRMKIAEMQQDKAPAAMMQSATFAQGALSTLADAEVAMQSLEQRGVMGSLPANKVEDWIFGKGLVDPSLDAQTRKDIGTLRSALGYTSSAAMRAHTGRTSQEIYNDFKSSLGPGQDWSALRGAMDETKKIMTQYSQAASDANIQNLRGGGGAAPSQSPKAPPAGMPHQVIVNGKVVGITTDGGKTMRPVQ